VVRAGEVFKAPQGSEVVLEDGSIVQGNEVRGDLPLGYHSLVSDEGTASLIVSPGSCFLPEGLRTWGWAVQLYALRSKASWGIGDLGDLAELARWSAAAGAGMTLVNPLHATGPGIPQEASPYYPGSRCFRNPLYLRIEDVRGAGDLDQLPELRAAGSALNEDRRIDRDAVYGLKMRALELLWARRPGDVAFDAFRSEQGDALEGFATFMALAETNEGVWQSWPAEFRHPDGWGVRAFSEQNTSRIRFHAWVQWLLDRQLETASEHLDVMHDLAVGVSPSGPDAWMWQDSFAGGTSVGAPPDDYNTDGQDWGVLAFHPHRLAATGYEPFTRTLRSSMRHAGGVRIDHVMGLFRLYWIPEGVSARDGAYVGYPASDLLDILALESHRAEAYVVGEDLGTVEPRVRDEMTRRSMLSYKLLWFESDAPSDFPACSLAAVNSHDLPTTAGLWTGSDAKAAEERGEDPNQDFVDGMIGRLTGHLGIDEGAPLDEVITRSYEVLADAASAVVVASIEDTIAAHERYNNPGTSGDWNWSTALPASLEEIVATPLASAIAATMSRARGDGRPDG
jgi:4-alpha-glucanotransferase